MPVPYSQGGKINAYQTPSDLSVEEQLAAGASVDDLIESGQLHDDYDPDNDPDYFFTPLEPVKEPVDSSPMSDEEVAALMVRIKDFSLYRRPGDKVQSVSPQQPNSGLEEQQ